MDHGSWGLPRRSLGNFQGASGLLLSSIVGELPGKSPGNFLGSSQERQRHINVNIILSGDCLGEEGSPNRVGRGQMFMC